MTELFHLVAKPRQETSSPYPCLVLLHGRGSNEEDLFGLVPELPPSTLVVSVRAPFPFEWGGYFWYDLGNPAHKPEETTFTQAVDSLGEFVRSLPEKYQVDPARVFLFGFSQGALMAGCLTLKEPSLVSGTVMCSGYLPPAANFAVDVSGMADKPVFQAHGTYDGVLPIGLAQMARDYLRGLGADVEYHEYPMDHQVIMDELDDLKSWFARQRLR